MVDSLQMGEFFAESIERMPIDRYRFAVLDTGEGEVHLSPYFHATFEEAIETYITTTVINPIESLIKQSQKQASAAGYDITGMASNAQQEIYDFCKDKSNGLWDRFKKAVEYNWGLYLEPVTSKVLILDTEKYTVMILDSEDIDGYTHGESSDPIMYGIKYHIWLYESNIATMEEMFGKAIELVSESDFYGNDSGTSSGS